MSTRILSPDQAARRPDLCVYCLEKGCEDGSVKHQPDCPESVNLWVLEEWNTPEEGICCHCHGNRLNPGDFYTTIDTGSARMHPVTGELLPMLEIVCLDGGAEKLLSQ